METFDIYISGKLLDGVSAETATPALAKVLKLDEPRAAALLDGKPHLLKRKVSRETAVKFKAVLANVGVHLAAKKIEAEPQSEPESTAAAETKAAAPETDSSAKTENQAQAKDSASLELDQPGTPTLRDNERQSFVPATIDTSALSASLSDRLAPEKAAPPPVPDVDFPLAPVGADLDELPREAPIKMPDISHLKTEELNP